MKLTRRVRRLASKFAAGRVTVYACNAGPDKGFAPRWRPKVAGSLVALTGAPDEGYPTRGEAIAAGRQYREECRAVLPMRGFAMKSRQAEYRQAVKLVESIGMSVSDDGVAFTVCGGQLVNGDVAPPNVQTMNGWTVDEVAAEIKAGRVR